MRWFPLVLLLASLAGHSQAEIYRWVDEQGRVHFGQRPQRMGRELAQFDKRMYWYEKDASGKKVEVDTRRVQERRAEIQALIRERC